MNDLGEGETKKDILAAVNSGDYSVSPDQLRRWHRVGILPRPKQDHLGRRGSQTVYPSGTTDQVIEICRIQQKERRFAFIAWELWWNGFEVEPQVIRKFMKRSVDEWEKAKLKISGLDTEALNSKIEASGEARFKNKVIRKARKRIGRKNFPDFFKAQLAVGLGTYSKQTLEAQSDQMMVEKAFDLERAREQQIGEIRPWMNGEQLNEASKFFGQLEFSVILSNITDEELTQARNLSCVLNDSLVAAGQVMDKTFGKSAFAFSAIGSLLKSSPAIIQPLIILFWLALQRNKDTREAVKFTIENQHQFEEIVFYDQGLELLKTEIPGVEALLSPRKRRAAMRSQKSNDKYLAELRKFYAEHKTELDEFWKRHPEFIVPEN